MAREKNKNSPHTEDTQPVALNKWWVRGTSEAQDFFEVSAETLSNWEKRGAPKEGYGKWDIKKIIEWKYGVSAGDKSPEARRLVADADLKEAKAGQEAIKLSLAAGKYISTSEVTQDLKRLFSILKKSLTAIGHDVATELNVLDPDIALTAKKVVDDAVYNALKQLAEKGEYLQRKK